jgi:hypothetical protein
MTPRSAAVIARGTVLIASVLLAVGISACGSSKKSTSTAAATPQTSTQPATSIPSPTPATALDPAFIARANAVCARAKRSIDTHGPFPYSNFDPLHPEVGLLPKVAAFFAATRSIGDRVPLELRDLGTPRKAAGQWNELLALARQARGIADVQIKAANGSNVAAFVGTVRAVQSTNMQLGRVGLESGFGPSSPCVAIL